MRKNIAYSQLHQVNWSKDPSEAKKQQMAYVGAEAVLTGQAIGHLQALRNRDILISVECF